MTQVTDQAPQPELRESDILARHRAAARAERRNLVLQRLGLLAAIVVSWELFALQTSPILMPRFTSTAQALAQLIRSGVLVGAFWESLQVLFLGYALAIAVGISVGLLMGTVKLMGTALDPYLTIGLATPISATIPVFIVIFGLGMDGRVAIVFVFTVMYVTVNTLAGVQSVQRELVEMARSFTLSRSQLFRWVVLPGAVPLILAGIRIGFGRAVIGMLLSELLMVAVGVGGLILVFGNELRTAELFATILVVLFFAVTGGTVIQWLERRWSWSHH